MNDEKRDKPRQLPTLAEQVGSKARLKLKARQDPSHVWFGLGMMGLVGWSVVVPTLAGAAFGIWLDRSQPGAFSWTLSMLLAGLMIGCLNAWYWVAKEDRAMAEQRGDRDA
ncbi:AtpZ/AtpI family protein [Engelhardtia mirabilis]|uniref:F0F1-ATPase subunit (ATPase_gene1) n=1 Tax=Engelhardtia mirabilis TaxID=2528011 RepID=A0A518BE75_9BACT|nr:Putative F0F1-ATPase subunit (ATPase_gene1) [Planctomycetes bacterium Pla133]QDU99588.1 Putative F0F1-ATPase subunit (ATPase_gene1) [Planctomycetes bacterium Pla86]